MANLSKIKRDQLLNEIKNIENKYPADTDTLNTLNKLKQEIINKKYGLVWEEHSEKVDEMIVDNIPVFTEDKSREIVSDPNLPYNFLIEGDNLHALKLLEKTHKGKIDVIYIDPPYNTGKDDDFIYDDNIVDKNDTYKHSKWLSFMESRLLIARKLLTNNGVIAISIGYQEVNDLMLLCKEIFSPMHVVCVTVKTSGGKPNGGFNYMHEYVIFIASMDFLPNESINEQTEYASPYHAMTLANFNQINRPNQTYPIYIDAKGKIVGCGSSLTEKINNGEYVGKKEDYVFDYSATPEGTVAIYPVTKKGDPCVWRLISSQLLENYKKGYIKVTPQKESKKNKNKFNIQYLAEGVIKKIENGEFETERKDPDKPTIDVIGYKTAGANISTIWLNKSFYTTKGSNSITDLMGRNVFSYPKPVELIYEILQRTTHEDSTVLDFFAGSGTTAQAVLELNKEDGGNRKFILCTNNENNICENVTYPRIKTVITGKRIDETTYSNGIPANLKYYKTDFVPKNSNQIQTQTNQQIDPNSGLKEVTLSDLLHVQVHHKLFQKNNF